MKEKVLKIVKVRDVKTPERGTEFSAGLDFYIPNDFNNGNDYVVEPQTDVLIKSGIRACIPSGFMLMAAEKSGIATSKTAMIEAGNTPKSSNPDSSLVIGAKIVDEDYQGEIGLHIINVGNRNTVVRPGQKITQFILVPVVYCDVEVHNNPEDIFAAETQRGTGGFGSTNV